VPSADVTTKPRPSTSAWIIALIVLAMVLMLLVAGLPGTAERTAGDGSDKLRHGWARQRAEEAERAAAEQATSPSEPAAPPADAPR
jgi:hypothetical protein